MDYPVRPFPSERINRMPATPNHALQRTAPRVTLAATDHPAACAHPAPAMFPQPARRAPQSLSLGSLDVASSLLSNHASIKASCESMPLSETYTLVSVSFTSSPSAAVWRSQRSTVSARPSFSSAAASPVLDRPTVWPSLSRMRSADSPFWPVVTGRFLPTPATSNYALQRTAPARHPGCSRPPRCARPQPPFRSRCAAPPQSLSLGSFGDV